MSVDSALRRPLIVVEPEHEGHRMMYFAAVAEHLLARGVGVTLASTRAGLDSDDLALRLPDAAARIGRIDLDDAGGDGAGPAAVIRAVATLQARHPGSEVLVTEGDKFLPAALLAAGGIDWRRLRVLVMRAPAGGDARPRARLQDALKAAAIRVALHRGADVRVLEQSTPVRPRYRGGPRGRWASVPDPVDVAPGVLPAGPAASGTLRVGVLGHVSLRKNLDLVLDAARLAGPRVEVLVAGRVAPEVWERCAPARARFAATGGTLTVVDRLLDDGELDACIAAVDAVVLAHSSEGPSGILGKAVALGTPVVAAGARSLRAEVERLDAGTWTPLQAGGLAAALRATDGARRPPRALAGSSDFARALLDDPPA